MIDINQRYDKSLLLLALTYHNRKTTLGYIPILFPPATAAAITLMMVVVVVIVEVQMKIDQMVMIFIATTHISEQNSIITTTQQANKI